MFYPVSPDDPIFTVQLEEENLPWSQHVRGASFPEGTFPYWGRDLIKYTMFHQSR